MRKYYFLLSLMVLSFGAFAQSTSWMAADSAKNVVKPGSGPINPVWSITGTQPLVHNGSSYNNMIWGGGNNTNMDYAYFYDFGLNVPTTSTITGVEVIVARGGCNSTDHAEDTVRLAYNGNYMGNYIAGSMPDSGTTDTVGASNDTWGNLLTPTIVNNYTFGVFFTTKAFGTCTFSISDLRVKVHYNTSTGIEEVASSPSLRVHPNPATSTITIASKSGYHITDQLGRVVLNGTTSVDQHIDISSLSPGLYFVHSGDGVAKFVKQ